MTTGAAHQVSTQRRMRPAAVGQPVNVGHGEGVDMLLNKDPQAVEIYTLTIDTATDDEDYGVNLTDPVQRSLSIDSGTGSTTTTIAAAIAAAWNADPIFATYGTAVAAVAVVTITGRVPGIAFTVAEDENAAKMTLANTQNAAEADAVPFGRAMISLAWEAGYADELGILAKSSALEAQVDSYAITYDAGIEISAVIEVDGETYETVPFAMATDAATVAAALDAAIDAAVPANTVVATSSTNNTIITSELAGRPFRSYVKFGVGATTAAAAKTSSEGEVATDINLALAGISQRSADVEVTSGAAEVAEYAPNDGVTVRKQGKIWVERESGASITPKSPVYVELDGTGSDAGKLFTTGSATRALVDSKLLRWDRADASDVDSSLAVVSVGLAL